MAPPEIYASELATLGYGYPLWFPEPDPLKGEVQIGDVGFVKNGIFTRIFNICQDPHNVTNDISSNLEPFGVIPPEFLQSRAYAIQGPVCSQSVISQGAKATIEGDASVARGELKYEYTCSQDRGAMLLLEAAHMQVVQTHKGFTEFIRKNHEKWVRHIQEKKYDVEPLDIIVVRGWYKTNQWTVAAVDRSNQSHKGAVQICLSLGMGGAGIGVQQDITRESGAAYRTGPVRGRSGLPSPLPAQISPPPLEPRCDQCVFLPHYKVKYRFFAFKTIKASAGYDTLPDDHPGEGVTEVNTDADISTVYEPLDSLLDYILENSTADMAIACEDDISSLFPGLVWPREGLAVWLKMHRPEIEVEDGAGMLSLEAAIRKETLYRIRNRAHPWQENDIAVDDDNLSGPPTNTESDRIIGEGELLLGRKLPGGSPTRWYHLRLYDKEAEGGSVSCTSISPVGDLLATSSDDNNVRLWNTKTGEMVNNYEGHEDCVWSVVFSPDGNSIASGSADTTIRIWSVEHPNTSPGVLEGHEADVWTVAYSPDGRKLASGSVDFTVKIWDIDTLRVLHSLESQSANIMHIAWTTDSARVISCVDDTGRIWDTESGMLVAEMRGHESSIWCMTVSKAGDRVITGSEDTTSRIWDTTTGEELVTLHEHTEPVWAVAFSPDDSEVVTGSYDRTLSINDSWTGVVQATFTGGNSTIDSAAYSTGGKYLASGSADGCIRVWDRGSGELLGELRGHKDKVKSLSFSKDDADIYSSSDDGSIRVWNMRDLLRLV